MPAKFEGVAINLGGTEYTVPPLSLGQIKKYKDLLSQIKVSNDPTVEDFDNLLTVIHAALSRNYPEITVEQLTEMIDLGNLGMVVQAVMGVSGLKKLIAAAQST